MRFQRTRQFQDLLRLNVTSGRDLRHYRWLKQKITIRYEKSINKSNKKKMGRSQEIVILRFDNGPQTHDVFIFWCVTCLIGGKKQYKIKRNGTREEEKLVEVSKERKEEEESSACRKHIKAVSQLCCKDQKNASAETVRKKLVRNFITDY